MDEQTKITELKGVGDKTAEALSKLSIFTVGDLLTYYPRSYDCFESPVPVSIAREVDFCAVCGTVLGPVDCVTVHGLLIVTAKIRDDAGDVLPVRWYRASWIRKTLHAGERAVFRGRIGRGKRSEAQIYLSQPEIYSEEKYKSEQKERHPVYSVTAGITGKTISRLMRQAFMQVGALPETLPAGILSDYSLTDRKQALYQIHFPSSDDQFFSARKRLVFEEFYHFLMEVKGLKEDSAKEVSHFVIVPRKETDQLVRELPYELTGAQKRVFAEIRADLSGTGLMNRLIEGDVGSGKTIVAFLALYETVLNGHQAALMAPTEVLARQHYQSFLTLIREHHLKVRIQLLTGALSPAEKADARRQIENHEADLVIGTHALIQDQVKFSDLALVVTDEQHRFGVRQREALSEKGDSPHVLMMSATPIPRTLAMILYADLSISMLDEMPKNRLPVKTCVIGPSKRRSAYRFIEQQISSGRQVYVVCPLVDWSEQIAAENVLSTARNLDEFFSHRFCVKVLHGKMKNEEKNRLMSEFAAGKIDILVATTVIEVGIDVPNASTILIENADRFGLAELHQLRGRVGRGKEQSYCILIDSSGKKETNERLSILCHSTDGFFIAEEDMRLRGPGDFFGIRQSGAFSFALGDIYADQDLLLAAEEAVNRVYKENV